MCTACFFPTTKPQGGRSCRCRPVSGARTAPYEAPPLPPPQRVVAYSQRRRLADQCRFSPTQKVWLSDGRTAAAWSIEVALSATTGRVLCVNQLTRIEATSTGSSAALVRSSRMAIQMSQSALADKLGAALQQVQKYEKATNRISCATLYCCAEALEVRWDLLLSAPAEDRQR